MFVYITFKPENLELVRAFVRERGEFVLLRHHIMMMGMAFQENDHLFLYKLLLDDVIVSYSIEKET